ncbi:solute carrier family 25 member 44 [Alligator mississippiensis]|uniref:Solute carrier family 25 member 44 n=1 Tax=Alligator mississippiensis TaxID=8496 RepID=A0A151NY28_ALLMI|nr:solute carrier family 25 member 44 [Alligator mississippiensis]
MLTLTRESTGGDTLGPGGQDLGGQQQPGAQNDQEKAALVAHRFSSSASSLEGSHAGQTKHPDHRMGTSGQEEVLCVQKGKSLYNGTFDAFVKILRTEGASGLYRGFLVNTFTLISGQCYVTTYELTRKYVACYSNSNTVKSLVAGGSASLVAQSITVPIDIVSQHLMMQRKGETMGRFRIQNSDCKRALVFGQTKEVIVQIFKADGLRGFYRGYVASLLTYIPNSAVWWPFYHFYAEQLSRLTPKDCPHLLLQAISGPLAAATASTLTNPMDVIRARVQVEGKNSIILTFKQLMAEEGPWGLTKGLSARIISATPSTIVIVVGYETLKKLSLRPEFMDSRHW